MHRYVTNLIAAGLAAVLTAGATWADDKHGNGGGGHSGGGRHASNDHKGSGRHSQGNSGKTNAAHHARHQKASDGVHHTGSYGQRQQDTNKHGNKGHQRTARKEHSKRLRGIGGAKERCFDSQLVGKHNGPKRYLDGCVTDKNYHTKYGKK